jgi:6-hydroxycyclohex-1-ene-1-carbonyl-CoA dehydrogenase
MSTVTSPLMASSASQTAYAWYMVPDTSASNGFRFERRESALPEPADGEALVEVAGCGVCGTDLSYFSGKVPTAIAPPLVLGHEISGRVVRGGGLEGRAVIVPTVVPCRSCELCRSGRANRCFKQKMYGGNFGTRGGFGSHVLVPARELCLVPADAAIPLQKLAVVADAISTPYQAVCRAQVGPGSKVVVIGATGGLGIHTAQWCRARGAEVVVGIARDQALLAEVGQRNYTGTVSSLGQSDDDVRHAVWKCAKEQGVNPRVGWTIFETSGTLAGQAMGLNLLVTASRLVLVGFAAGDITYPLSKVMANDAEIIGSWGCDPAHYPAVLEAVLAGRIDLESFVELRAMETISSTFQRLMAGGRSLRRVVLTP